MKKILSLSILIVLLGSCENVRKGMGVQKDVPDEFLIEKRSPLVMPPNFDLLPPNSVTALDNKQDVKKDEKDSLKEMFNKNLDTIEKEKNIESNKKEISSGSLEKSILDKVR